MTVTLIGSRALASWYEDARVPAGDWDWQSDHEVRWEREDANGRHDMFVDARLAAWSWSGVATPDELYTMKISHSFWEINGPQQWDKHASDIVFLSRKRAQFLRPLHDILLPIWKERYRKNPTSLNQTAGTFFNDAVNRRYDHDSLHESIAYGTRPLYEQILKPGETVAVDSEKFRAMPPRVRIMLVREEIYATALERILIPNDYHGSPSAAYHWALRRTATSLFKGDWALFVMLNLDELMRPDCDYVARHLQNKHMLRPIGE